MGTIELDAKVKELRELRRMAEELAAEIAGLRTLTSISDLYSKLAGSLNAIMGGLAVCLSEVVEQKGGVPEAPAAE